MKKKELIEKLTKENNELRKENSECFELINFFNLRSSANREFIEELKNDNAILLDIIEELRGIVAEMEKEAVKDSEEQETTIVGYPVSITIDGVTINGDNLGVSGPLDKISKLKWNFNTLNKTITK